MTVAKPKTKDLAKDMAAKVDDAIESIDAAGRALDDEPEADKKDEYYSDTVLVTEVAKPYGGATSFAALAEAQKMQRTQWAVSDLFYAFDQIVENIKSTPETDMSVTDKAAATVAAAKELAALVSSPLTSAQQIGLAEKKDAKSSVWQYVKGLFGTKEDEQGFGSAFWSFKDLKGEWRWLSAYSNNFKDRDGEIFTEAAHKDFVQAADRLQRYPELWVWHTPGSRIGFCDFLDVSDGFIVASGKYDEPDVMGPKMAAKAATSGVSHGYRYPSDAKDADGTIHRYFDFEISVLPQRRASNPHMPLDFVLKEGSKMTFEKRQELVDVLGDPMTTALEEALGENKEKLMQQGIDWKAVKEALATPAVEAKPDASAVAVADKPAADPDPKPEPDPAPEGELAVRVGKIEEALVTLAEATKQISIDVKAIKTDTDAEIANQMSPRRREPNPENRPSQSDATALSDEKAAEVRAAIEGDDKSKEPVNPAAKYVADLIKVGQ